MIRASTNILKRNSPPYDGFTIVELLIVIVVIGILATISIVAYSGIQGRSNNVAIQTDLRQFAHAVEQFNAVNGRYPIGPGNTDAIEGIPKFRLAQKSYRTDIHNFYYCVDSTNGSSKYAVAAVSMSGDMFAYYSGRGIQPYSGAWSASSSICPGLGVVSYTFGYGHNSASGWNGWTQ